MFLVGFFEPLQQRRKASCRNVTHTLDHITRFIMQASRTTNTLATISKAGLVLHERSIYLSYIRRGASREVLLSPDLTGEILLPVWKRICRFVKSQSTQPLLLVDRIQNSIDLVDDTVVGKNISLEHLGIVKKDTRIHQRDRNNAPLKSTSSETIRQLTRNNDIRKDMVEKGRFQSVLSFKTDEEGEDRSFKLGKGAVGGSDQGELSRSTKDSIESSKDHKRKESAQVMVLSHTVGDAVTHPARDQDTVNDVGNTIRGAEVPRNDEVSVNKERRTGDCHTLAVEGNKKFTIKEYMLVGSDLGTQDVVKEEIS
jgi:hypothetical protein